MPAKVRTVVAGETVIIGEIFAVNAKELSAIPANHLDASTNGIKVMDESLRLMGENVDGKDYTVRIVVTRQPVNDKEQLAIDTLVATGKARQADKLAKDERLTKERIQQNADAMRQGIEAARMADERAKAKEAIELAQARALLEKHAAKV